MRFGAGEGLSDEGVSGTVTPARIEVGRVGMLSESALLVTTDDDDDDCGD